MDLVGQDDVRRRHWVNDIDVSNCHGCNEPFNPIGRRRHHCRQCGEVRMTHLTVYLWTTNLGDVFLFIFLSTQVVCAECSSVRVPLPEKFGYGLMKVRVCDSCVMKGAHPEMQELDDQLVIRERINKSLKEALVCVTDIVIIIEVIMRQWDCFKVQFYPSTWIRHCLCAICICCLLRS